MGKITRGIIMAQININLSIVIYRTLLITPDTLLEIFVVLIQRTLQCFNITFVLNIRTIL